MKTKSLCCLIILLNSLTLIAQKTKLTLIVRDDKKELLQHVSVSLFRLPDSAIQYRGLISGTSVIDVDVQSSYLVRASVAGKEPFSRELNVKDSAVSLQIDMITKISSLGNVTVVSKRPLIKQDDDKTVVDAEVLASGSTNAYEVLEKTPGAIVDQDGNVYLNSTIPATVYINGREMKLSSADIASLLKSLPAGSISKIEILRTPSAKFDASGSGGIVNIVLKKGVKLGTNGSFNAGYFQGIYSTKTAGFNINKGSGKVNSYLSYQFTGRNNFEELNSDRFIRLDSSVLSQRSYTTYPSVNNYLGAGTDIAFTTKFNISYDLRISKNDGKSFAVNRIAIRDMKTQGISGTNESDINNFNNSTYIGNNIIAKLKLDSAGSEWVSQVEYNHYTNKNEQEYQNLFYLPASNTISGDGNNRNRKNIFVLQSDLTWKFPSKFTIEAGIKSTFSNSNNSSVYFKDSTNGNWFTDVYQTNTFKYRENITAAYVQVSKTFFGFTIKPGLRFESTNIHGGQLVPKDTTLTIDRTDFFPYIYIRHNLFKIFGTQLVGSAIYRRSIKRPYYEILNPYPKYIDQYLFDVGNPRLKPQFTENYELNATFNEIPVLAIGLNDTKDIFSNVTYQDNITKIAYRTYDNLGRNKEIYARIIGGIPPGGKYFVYVGGQYNYNMYRGYYQGRPLNYDRGSLTIFMFQEFKATPTFTMNMQGFLRTKGLQNFYELNTFGGLFVSVNKAILKKKMNIILSVNDLLRTNHVSFRLKQADVDASGSRVNDTRKLGITIRYNFGIKPKEEKKNGFDAPAETN